VREEREIPKGKILSRPWVKPYHGSRGRPPDGDGVKDDRVILVLSTVPESESAGIATTLVSERLVACVNATPVRSWYWWKGEICRDREELLVMKTRESLVPSVLERVKEIHPYEVPEILALPVWGGFPGYLRWVMEETGSPEGP
jgi:periplasmic divalent cation tolerance protein